MLRLRLVQRGLFRPPGVIIFLAVTAFSDLNVQAQGLVVRLEAFLLLVEERVFVGRCLGSLAGLGLLLEGLQVLVQLREGGPQASVELQHLLEDLPVDGAVDCGKLIERRIDGIYDREEDYSC